MLKDGTARTNSRITAFSVSPVCEPFTKMAVLASSISFGKRASNTRFDRAFFGFLRQKQKIRIKGSRKFNTYIVRSIAAQTVAEQRSRRGENATMDYVTFSF